MYKKYVKRGIDIILSLGGLIVLSPVFLLLCIAIKIDSRGPILFKQKRVGIHKKYFNILKCKTHESLSSANGRVKIKEEKLIIDERIKSLSDMVNFQLNL